MNRACIGLTRRSVSVQVCRMSSQPIKFNEPTSAAADEEDALAMGWKKKSEYYKDIEGTMYTMPKSQLKGSIYLDQKLRNMGAKTDVAQRTTTLTKMQKRLMVWTFIYRRLADVPDVVHFELYYRMRDRFRILIASFIMFVASVFYTLLHWQQRSWIEQENMRRSHEHLMRHMRRMRDEET